MPHITHRLLAGVMTGLTALCAQAPGSWVALPFATHPGAREFHAMAFDTWRNRAVLFGGHDGTYLGDTWELDGTGWSQVTPATSPPARAEHTLAFDPVRGRTVLFGGVTQNNAELADIWEWDGANWTQVAAQVPGIGRGGQATYDPLQGGVFYSRNLTNLLWTGTSVNNVLVVNMSGTTHNPIVFSPALGGVVQMQYSATKVFTVPSGWQTLTTQSPVAANQYAIAIDPPHDRVILQGGNGQIGNSSGNSIGHTWEWRAGAWAGFPDGNPLLARHTMVYDWNRGTLVLFGGRHNTGFLADVTYAWQDPHVPAAYEPFGQGCPGALPQIPRLRADPQWNTAPILGGQFIALLDRLPPASPVLGVFGLSDLMCQNTPLPHPLANYGMPGCELLVSTDVVVNLGLSTAAGTARWIAAVPAQPALLGLRCFQQGACTAPGANAGGMVWSNGCRATIGAF